MRRKRFGMDKWKLRKGCMKPHVPTYRIIICINDSFTLCSDVAQSTTSGPILYSNTETGSIENLSERGSGAGQGCGVSDERNALFSSKGGFRLTDSL